jgi:hypothetical protein
MTRQWTNEDVQRAKPDELLAAVAFGRCAELGFGTGTDGRGRARVDAPRSVTKRRELAEALARYEQRYPDEPQGLTQAQAEAFAAAAVQATRGDAA